MTKYYYKVKLDKQNQLELFRLGYAWASGDKVPLYLDEKGRYIKVDKERRMLWLMRKEDHSIHKTLEGFDDNSSPADIKVLKNGYIKKDEYGNYRFYPFTYTLEFPELYDNWVNWLEQIEEIE